MHTCELFLLNNSVGMSVTSGEEEQQAVEEVQVDEVTAKLQQPM